MPTSLKRSGERLMFCFKTHDTPTTVKRSTVQSAAESLGMDETTFLHLAAAQFIKSLDAGANGTAQPPDDGRLTVAQLQAIRSMVPQEVSATRSFLSMLNK